jgi:hypothetical protein
MVFSVRGKAVRKRSLHASSVVLLGASALLLLTGCGAQNGLNLAGSPQESQGIGIQGIVHGGEQPVSGAAVYLYEAGAGGYGTAPKLLASTTTGSSAGDKGTFNIPSTSYTCDAAPKDQTFLLAEGGNPGGGTNPNLVLMAALGPCSGLDALTTVDIDEVTTVASAFALAQFLTYSSTIDTPPASSVAAGTIPNIAVPAGGASCNSAGGWLSTGAGTCNYLGLSNAMLTAQNLVNVETGLAPADSIPFQYYTGGYASGAGDTSAGHTGYAPSARLNTLADILAACVNSQGGVAGGSASNCNTLFTATTPASTGIAPTDTLQAILNLAQNPQLSPANNSAFFGLVPANPPFNSPAPLTAAPNDWTLALAYTGGGFANATLAPSSQSATYSAGLSIDSQGNIWAASLADGSTAAGAIVGLNNQGVPLTPNTTSTAWGGFQTDVEYPETSPAIDMSGNIWFANIGNGTTETLAALTPSGAALTTLNSGSPVTLPAAFSAGSPSGVAIASSGSVWVDGYDSSATNGELVEFASSGTQTLTDSWSNPAFSSNNISLDHAGNVWVTTTDGDLEIISSGSSITQTNQFASSANYGQLAVNSSGDVFGCNGGDIYEDKPLSSSTVTLSTTGGCNASAAVFSIFAPDTLDGAGNLWEPLVSATGIIGNLSEVSSSSGSILSPATYGYQGIGTPGNVSSDGEGSTILISNGPPGSENIAGIAVDQSGNVWVLNAYAATGVASQQLVEFVGLGTPTVQPTVLAQKYNTFTVLP